VAVVVCHQDFAVAAGSKASILHADEIGGLFGKYILRASEEIGGLLGKYIP
jgi:hypothetical protein